MNFLRYARALFGAPLALIATALMPLATLAQVSVSDGGSATYSYPIAVPPGVAGMSPKIGLFYAGGGVNGPVGHGWSVQGISLITRCPPTFSVDGARTGVAYSASDKLCLDGQRLIQTDANGSTTNVAQTNDAFGASNGYREFRTEKDTYARVRGYGAANSDANNGYSYFKVWTKSGQVYEYGASPSATSTTNALIAAQGKNIVSAWAVSRISDTLGNFIDFKYTQQPKSWGSGTSTANPLLGFEWNLGEIQYSGNKVVFGYDDLRTDKSEAYHLGSKNVSVARLNTITTYVNAPPANLGAPTGSIAVKTIKLAYDTTSTTGRSRVSTITECAGATSKCSPPTKFSYSAGGKTASYVANSNFATSTLATTMLQNQAGTLGVLMADFDGDGKMDFIRWSDTPSQNQLYISNGDGSFRQSNAFNINDQNIFKSDGCYYSQIVDINGDGLPDILRYSASTNLNGGSCASYGPVYLYINAGNGSFNRVTYQGPTLQRLVSVPLPCTGSGVTCGGWNEGDNFFLMDVNGDGKLDIVTTKLPLHLGGNRPLSECSSGGCTSVYLGVGDGTFKSQSTNIGTLSLYIAPVAGTGFGSPKNIADLNGDGLADIVGIPTNAYNSVYALISAGDGTFVTGAGADCSYPIDFNGDGRADCLSIKSGTSLYLNDGAKNWATVTGFNLGKSGSELSGSGVGFVFGDFNGDGLQDILRYKNDPTQTALYLSKGDGTFTPDTTFTEFSSTANQLQTADGKTSFVTGDFSGRGAVEILRFKDSPTAGAATANQLFTKGDPTPADLLISVQSPMGLTTTLNYRPLSNSSSPVGTGTDLRYTRDTSGTPPNALDITVPMYVVTEQTTDAPLVGGGYANTSRYKYYGLKADLAGRGLLGFKRIDREGLAPGGNLLVSTNYLQVHPYIGVASDTSTSVGGLGSSGQVISTTANLYCDQTSGSSAPVPTAAAPCTTASKVQRPYLYSSVETAAELGNNGAELPKVTTVNTFNGSGDSSTITTTTQLVSDPSATFVKTTTNTYFADQTASDAWVLGRLQTATVRSTVPNTIPNASYGSAANANATAGTTPNGALPPAMSTAQLMSILQILLLDD